MGSLLSEVLTLGSDGSISQTGGSNTLKETTVAKLTSTGNISQSGTDSTTSLGNTTVSALTSTGNIIQSGTGSTTTLLALTTGSINQPSTVISKNVIQESSIDKVCCSFLFPSSSSSTYNPSSILQNIINIGRDDGTTQIILNGQITYTNNQYNIGLSEYMNQFAW